MSQKSKIDYSLYLVTGRDLLPPGKNYLESLEESLQGGVTLVQLREKTADTAEFLDIALKSVDLCSRYNVPVLINDRIDIALASQAAGVHLGQTDMPIYMARRLLPEGSIIGLSINNVEQAAQAVKDDVDYIGIGAVWGTQTKKLTAPIVGVRGVGPILEKLAVAETDIKAVVIGGIKSSNLLRTLHGSVSSSGRALDGVAIVSEIVSSPDPKANAQALRRILDGFKTSSSPQHGLASIEEMTIDGIKAGVGNLLEAIRKTKPLIHQITNTVVTTQSANATLALGASPIMSASVEEMDELSAISGALLINAGTLATVNIREAMRKAGQGGNRATRPVILDPVGVGATTFRKGFKSKGVDSVGSGFKDPVTVVRDLARRERCIILLTGPIDYISDGKNVAILKNGPDLLGQITGSGCMLGTCVAAFCAAAFSEADPSSGKIVRGDMFLGAIGGVLALTVAAELANQRGEVKGAGTFLPALIDELADLTPEKIAQRANIELA